MAKESGAIDLVMPVLYGSNGLDRKYALRSISANISNLGKLHILDGMDDTRPMHKERSIYLKIMKAVEDKSVSSTFLVVHDDHFVLTPYNSFPWYYQTPTTYRKTYATTMQNTFAITGGERDYDVHCPFVVSKAGFKKLAKLDWNKPYGYGIKTMYAHMNKIDGELCTDLKLRDVYSRQEMDNMMRNRDWFSTSDNVMKGGVLSWIVSRFKEKSKWE